VDLNEATREVIECSLNRLQRDRVILRTELADDLPPIIGDRVQLQQVILNLLQKASDAMRQVEDRPRQLLIRTERDEGDRVRLTARFRNRFRPPSFGPGLRLILYNQKGRYGNRAIRESLHHREPSWPSMGRTE
jgi:signal transduction histidine kinase